MHLEVLVNPKRVQRCRVKAGQEHIHNNEEIQFLILHAEGNILVVILEPVGICGIVGVEHHVVIHDGFIQKIAGGLIQSRGIFGVFFAQKAVCFLLIWGVAVNHSDLQFLCRILLHLFAELPVILHSHGNRGNRKDGVEAADSLLGFDFLHGPAFCGGNIGDIGQLVKEIGLVPAIGFLVKMVQDVLCDEGNPLGSHEGFFPIDVIDKLIVHVLIHIHGLDIIHTERQDVLVVDGVHDGVLVQLVAKGLLCGIDNSLGFGACVGGEDGRAGKTEHIVVLESAALLVSFFINPTGNRRMHIPKLAAVAFVKDDDHLFGIDRMLLVLFDKGRELLNRRDDDTGSTVTKLLCQDRR